MPLGHTNMQQILDIWSEIGDLTMNSAKFTFAC